ncbi:1-(5-phosphoribosyl)-5-[(5-phosphoribosylamino)methylideneamino]imidazole-4-carboxamide isomerase [bacterium]|nr:1-(5-phosphoribosyl)-5-[(5-phosphoribosylamino)methylideneamino]imidazole-4-carboxamide isomerase [bacterium]
MLIVPAIDLLNEKVVRLSRGLEATAKMYSEDALETARAFEKAGAKWIHVVNLDGAFGRPGVNDQVISRLASGLTIPFELGGGIRTPDQIDFWLHLGVSRVVLGSSLLERPEMAEKAVQKYGSDAVTAGIDMKGGKVSIRGWLKDTPVDGLDLACNLKKAGLTRVILTDIASDGMLQGPRLERMTEIADRTGLAVTVSGGVGSLDDLARIAECRNNGIEAVIVGKAVYEKKLDLAEAVRRFQN